MKASSKFIIPEISWVLPGTCRLEIGISIRLLADNISKMLGIKKNTNVIIPSHSMWLSSEENETTALIIEGPKSDFDINAIDEFKNKYDAIVVLENDRAFLSVPLVTIINDIIKNIENEFALMYPKLIIDNPYTVTRYNEDKSIRSFSVLFEVATSPIIEK